MRILVIGSGGREHAIAWKLSQSKLVDKIYCAPGNGGTSLVAENIDISDIDKLLEFACAQKIDLTVVGPEAPLVDGIVDKFQAKGLKVFGPSKEVANLEGSKIFSKELMRKYNVPTADFRVFEDPDKAKEYINSKGAPIVVKADGLAARQGVIVCKSVGEAITAVDMIMVEKRFGAAGDKLIVEDCLEGEEASILVFTDGEKILPLVTSQDHKRIFDMDQGPNTGGMGAYAPAPLVSAKMFDRIINEVFKPIIDGLKAEGRPYRGVLYGGLMIKGNDISVLEFNVRFGDPETQVILPKLKSDLAQVMLAIANGDLGDIKLEWDDRFCVCVVLAAGGYPGSYEKNEVITGLDKASSHDDVFVFHAGTKHGEEFLTSGGRVLGVVALGEALATAQKKAYLAISDIHFAQMQYRNDIGNKALKFLPGTVK